MFTEASFVGATDADTTLVREILRLTHAAVLIPRAPLAPGATYAVFLTIDGTPSAWSFAVAPDAG